MFLKKIKTHNYINGLKFSAIEFILATIFIAPFCIYYFIHGKYIYATIASGLILNFLTIVFFAILSIYKKEKSIGLRFYFDPEKRKTVSHKYPHLTIDTLLLCIGVLVPFSLFVVTLYESVESVPHG